MANRKTKKPRTKTPASELKKVAFVDKYTIQVDGNHCNCQIKWSVSGKGLISIDPKITTDMIDFISEEQREAMLQNVLNRTRKILDEAIAKRAEVVAAMEGKDPNQLSLEAAIGSPATEV